MLGTLVILTSTALSQSPEAVVISPDFVVEGRVVKGSPYTAQAVTSVKQTLPSGSEISSEMRAVVARDSEGRTRREQTLRSIGPWALSSGVEGRSREGEARRNEIPTVILIQDPVKQVNYTLNPQNHTARGTRQRPLREMEPRSRPPSPEHPERGESLGTRVIEGIQAEGRRTTTVLPQGSIGNDAPLEIVAETWYSPELQVVVLGKRNDPRVGEITYRLVNIRRGEPSPSLFQVPPEYRIIEGEPGRK